ncbi:MAG: class I SAM-dependent methyltransferase [Anaerolineae bacterium]|nr:class I SAM-dependent methyltransferase [Anaerolineae bacterium]
MKSLSFDSMVALYDETRTFDQGCFDAALDFLVERLPPRHFHSVFEPGIGTGRIAIPLAERGYRVTGVDISREMLALLRGQPARMAAQQADTTRLPFVDAAFDAAIVVHLFYFIRGWKQAVGEILRVIRSDGAVVLMHTGTGAEVPFLNERYKALCADRGCPIEPMGVRSTREVIGYLASLGYQAEEIRDRWRWTACIRLDAALCYLQARAYSFTTVAPDDVHTNAVERLEAELRDRFGSLDVEVEIPNQVYLVILLKEPASIGWLCLSDNQDAVRGHSHLSLER